MIFDKDAALEPKTTAKNVRERLLLMHWLLCDVLVAYLEHARKGGEVTPAILNVARQFLRDNGIDLSQTAQAYGARQIMDAYYEQVQGFKAVLDRYDPIVLPSVVDEDDNSDDGNRD